MFNKARCRPRRTYISMTSLVMCLFILMHVSIIPAIISLIVLGSGLVFILLTLITYFFTWQQASRTHNNGKSSYFDSIHAHLIGISSVYDDDIDLTKAEERSTLV
jgi:uncharacterized membrane protein